MTENIEKISKSTPAQRQDNASKLAGGGYNLSLSCLRIMATLAVIFLHTSSTIKNNSEIFSLSENSTLLYQHCVSLMCWAVPCFFMITGALLLNRNRQITVKNCFSKYVRRIVIALFMFGTLFALMKTVFETKKISVQSIFDAISAVLQNESWDHLWYLYALIGIYLLLPILKRFTDNCTKDELLYACLLLLFFNCIIPVTDAACGIEIAVTVWLPLRPCFYILAGHYLNEYMPNVKPCFSAACAILSLAGIWVLDCCKPSDLSAAIKTCFVVLASIAVFMTFQTLQINITERHQNTLWHIDRLCFGVYLVHPVFIHLMYRFFRISPNNFGDSVFAIIIFFIGFAAVSFVASWIMSLVKPLKKYVL